MKILFRNVTAVTMDPARPVLQNACVAVEGTRIASVGQEHPRGEFDRVIDGQGKALLPGLVNCHTHVPMALLRGYGGGHDLQHWLNDYIFPAEARLDDRCVAAGTALGLAEMIASGTTCIADMYMHTGAVARTVLESGVSANLSCGGVYFGAPEDFSPDACGDCRNQIALTEEWNGAGDGQIKVDASIHAEYTSNPSLWEWMAGYAAEHGLGMHVHVSETRSEHESCLQKYGKTPVALLDRYGVWVNGGTAAHCVWVSDADMELMVQRNITAVHNPVSNLKLASGAARVPRLLERGVNVALGTDGVASNNSHDLFEEIKKALNGKIKDVKVNPTLQDHPVSLSSEGGISMEMEKILRKMPAGGEGMESTKVLELNPNHAVFGALKAAHEAGDTDKINKYAELLYDQALLIEGLPLEDRVAYAQLVCDLMQ
mgnify:CR=1 FL=1